MLIFSTENDVDQHAFVDDVVEAAARVPAVVAARDAVPRTERPANIGDARAMGVHEIGSRPASGRKHQQPVPGVTQSRTRREQIEDLVLAERIFVEAECNGKHIAPAAAFMLNAGNSRDFRAEDPGAPLPLRARVESEDAVAVARS